MHAVGARTVVAAAAAAAACRLLKPLAGALRHMPAALPRLPAPRRLHQHPGAPPGWPARPAAPPLHPPRPLVAPLPPSPTLPSPPDHVRRAATGACCATRCARPSRRTRTRRTRRRLSSRRRRECRRLLLLLLLLCICAAPAWADVAAVPPGCLSCAAGAAGSLTHGLHGQATMAPGWAAAGRAAGAPPEAARADRPTRLNRLAPCLLALACAVLCVA